MGRARGYTVLQATKTTDEENTVNANFHIFGGGGSVRVKQVSENCVMLEISDKDREVCIFIHDGDEGLLERISEAIRAHQVSKSNE